MIGQTLTSTKSMDIQDVLKWANDLVVAKTGDDLTNLQQAILTGVLNNRKYSDIAAKYHCSESRVKSVASDLWKTISTSLGKKVKRSNLRSFFERSQLSNLSTFGKDFIQIDSKDVRVFDSNDVQIGSVNFFPESSHNQLSKPSITNQRSTTNKETWIENQGTTNKRTKPILIDIPTTRTCYDRHSEITTLKKWICQDQKRIIALQGMSGIGKTTLAVQLIQQIQDQFNYIIWQSLDTCPTLDELLTNLIQVVSPQPLNDLPTTNNGKLSQLIQHLKEERCLIILDDLQAILVAGKLAGNYQPELANYHLLFQRIAQLSHRSCFLLNTWELPKDIVELINDNPAVGYLLLQGLGEGSQELLKQMGLTDAKNMDNLTQIYGTNPLHLKYLATTINNLFSGNIEQLLAYKRSLFLSDDLSANLERQFQRFSPVEQQVICKIAEHKDPVTIEAILPKIKVSYNDLLNSIKSLGERLWLERLVKDGETLFTIKPVLNEYLLSLK